MLWVKLKLNKKLGIMQVAWTMKGNRSLARQFLRGPNQPRSIYYIRYRVIFCSYQTVRESNWD